MKKIRGFTLIEILIAVAIIAILTAIGIVSYSSVNKRSRDAKRIGDLEQIRSALEMYRSDYGFYPSVNTGPFSSDYVSALSDTLVTGMYIPSLPTDPQPTVHTYLYKPNNQDNISGNFYGYCLCAYLETQSQADPALCPDTPPADMCTYVVRNP